MMFVAVHNQPSPESTGSKYIEELLPVLHHVVVAKLQFGMLLRVVMAKKKVDKGPG